MALRIVVYLAERNDTGLASAPEVSRILQVSYNNVVRIINRLQNAGLVITHAGRYGGMELALPVKKITVLAIVTAIDGPTKLSLCSRKDFYPGTHSCEVSNCTIREELIQLNKQIDDLLENVSIAMIIERNLQRKASQERGEERQDAKKSNAESALDANIAEAVPVPKAGRRKRASD